MKNLLIINRERFDRLLIVLRAPREEIKRQVVRKLFYFKYFLMIPNILFYFFFNFETIISKVQRLNYKNHGQMDCKFFISSFMCKCCIIRETYNKGPLLLLDFQRQFQLSKNVQN